ncbi:MAG: Monomeric sarcosine oxidase [Fimbriimonadaceae bacterium]|nr:Monomeric sarcosine oxidase [Fimbriimonadaceae bacterium]
MRVGIVGAGVMGSAVAWRLVSRGHEVTLFDRFDPGHRFGSSHGRSRIIRKAYPDPFYTEIMEEGYPMWRDVQALCKDQLLWETGLVYIGHKDAERVRQVYEGLAAVKDHPESWEPNSKEANSWDILLQHEEVAIYSRSAGWVHAERAWKAMFSEALRRGASLLLRTLDQDDEMEAFDVVVWSAGSGNAGLNHELTVRLQTFGYLKGDRPGGVFIDDGPGLIYGFPNEPGDDRFKVGLHEFGQSFDPSVERNPDPNSIQEIERFARRRFGIESELEEVSTCLYTVTPDEDFRIGWLDDRRLLVSPCSGHGFKFAPWIGKVVADILEGKRKAEDFPRFRLRS